MIDRMTEGTSQPCPSCGVNVLIGYTKCPKCHVAMPGAAARVKRASMAGGTTSERIEVIAAAGSGGRVFGVIVLVLGAGLAVWATQCRGKSRSAAPLAAPVETGPRVGSASVEPVATDPGATPTNPTRTDPAYAADALESELAGERLYATIDVEGDLLHVRSAFCAEVRLGEIVARYAGELRSGGVIRVRCSETHGAQVFERAL